MDRYGVWFRIIRDLIDCFYLIIIQIKLKKVLCNGVRSIVKDQILKSTEMTVEIVIFFL